MTCREAEPLLHAHLDHELDMAGSASIDHHLSECRACAAQYAALENLHEEIVAAELAYAPPPALEQKLAARFLREKKSPFSFWNKPFWSKPFWAKAWPNAYLTAGAAAGVAILIFSVSITRSSRATDAIGSKFSTITCALSSPATRWTCPAQTSTP